MRPFHSQFSINDGKPCWNGRPIPGADASSFKGLGGPWACDKNKVFVQYGQMRSIDRNSFEYINPVYAKDAENVYDWQGKISGADPKTFTALDPGITPKMSNVLGEIEYRSYGRDENAVFFHEQMVGKASLLKGADPKTFQSLRNGFGMDSRHVWHGKFKIKIAHAPSWLYLGSGYSIDREKVFYLDREIKNVNRERFCAIMLPGMNLATDGDSHFWNDTLIEYSKFAEYVEKECSRSHSWLSFQLQKNTDGAISA